MLRHLVGALVQLIYESTDSPIDPYVICIAMVRGSAGKDKLSASIKSAEAVSVWAQCDNQGCQKWRRLPPGTVVDDTVPW